MLLNGFYPRQVNLINLILIIESYSRISLINVVSINLAIQRSLNFFDHRFTDVKILLALLTTMLI